MNTQSVIAGAATQRRALILRRTIVCAVATILGTVACTSREHVSVADAEVREFHRLMQGTQFDAIYEKAAAEFKKTVSKSDFVAFLRASDGKLGPPQSSERVDANVNYELLTQTRVFLTFRTQFRNGKAVEHFGFRTDLRQPELIGYRIESVQLATQ